MNSESESSCDSKISHSTSWSGAKVVHSNKKRRMQRQNLNVPKDGIYSESDSSCNFRISESTSLSGATVASINKKLKAKRKHSNVLAAKKRNHSANEACENMTKKSRNNTEKSYSTTENGMPEGLKFDHFYHLLKTYQLTHHTLTYQSVLSLIPLFKIHRTHQLKVAVFTQMKRMMMLFNKPLTSRFQTMRMILTMKQHAVKNFISKNHLGKI